MITPFVGHFVTVIKWSIIIGQDTMRLLLHPMTMSCLKLPYQARVPVIRGLTRFLTMAEVALVQDGQDGELIIDCVAIFYEEGKGGENYRKKNKFRCRVSSTEKRLVKLKERIW